MNGNAMGRLTVTKTRIQGGIWHGVVTGAGSDAPQLDVLFQDTPIPDIALAADPDQPGVWCLDIPIPAAAIADGVQAIVVSDRETGAALTSFAVMTGDAIDDNLRAEVELLRAELDLLKRTFRRHCLETE